MIIYDYWFIDDYSWSMVVYVIIYVIIYAHVLVKWISGAQACWPPPMLGYCNDPPCCCLVTSNHCHPGQLVSSALRPMTTVFATCQPSKFCKVAGWSTLFTWLLNTSRYLRRYSHVLLPMKTGRTGRIFRWSSDELLSSPPLEHLATTIWDIF